MENNLYGAIPAPRPFDPARLSKTEEERFERAQKTAIPQILRLFLVEEVADFLIEAKEQRDVDNKMAAALWQKLLLGTALTPFAVEVIEAARMRVEADIETLESRPGITANEKQVAASLRYVAEYVFALVQYVADRPTLLKTRIASLKLPAFLKLPYFLAQLAAATGEIAVGGAFMALRLQKAGGVQNAMHRLPQSLRRVGAGAAVYGLISRLWGGFSSFFPPFHFMTYRTLPISAIAWTGNLVTKWLIVQPVQGLLALYFASTIIRPGIPEVAFSIFHPERMVEDVIGTLLDMGAHYFGTYDAKPYSEFQRLRGTILKQCHSVYREELAGLLGKLFLALAGTAAQVTSKSSFTGREAEKIIQELRSLLANVLPNLKQLWNLRNIPIFLSKNEADHVNEPHVDEVDILRQALNAFLDLNSGPGDPTGFKMQLLSTILGWPRAIGNSRALKQVTDILDTALQATPAVEGSIPKKEWDETSFKLDCQHLKVLLPAEAIDPIVAAFQPQRSFFKQSEGINQLTKAIAQLKAAPATDRPQALPVFLDAMAEMQRNEDAWFPDEASHTKFAAVKNALKEAARTQTAACFPAFAAAQETLRAKHAEYHVLRAQWIALHEAKDSVLEAHGAFDVVLKNQALYAVWEQDSKIEDHYLSGITTATEIREVCEKDPNALPVFDIDACLTECQYVSLQNTQHLQNKIDWLQTRIALLQDLNQLNEQQLADVKAICKTVAPRTKSAMPNNLGEAFLWSVWKGITASAHKCAELVRQAPRLIVRRLAEVGTESVAYSAAEAEAWARESAPMVLPLLQSRRQQLESLEEAAWEATFPMAPGEDATAKAYQSDDEKHAVPSLTGGSHGPK